MNRLARTRLYLSSATLVLAFGVYGAVATDPAIQAMPRLYRSIFLALMAAVIPIVVNLIINLVLRFEPGRRLIFRRSYI